MAGGDSDGERITMGGGDSDGKGRGGGGEGGLLYNIIVTLAF